MTHLDLFTGIGGFHLAAEWAGFETIGFSEIEPYCCKLLSEKWPDIPNYGDIRNTGNFESLRGRITILSAGVPCQPASLAGKRRGEKDDRWLWPATLDVVRCVEPAWAIFENPFSILTLDEFGGILLRLESLGYAVRAFSVPANALGAKHRRQRIFIVANRQIDRRQAGNLQDGSLNGSAIEEGGLELERKRSESIPGFRLTQSPLCRRADGLRGRVHRLKALGNAVVPQQAYPFFEAIARTESVPVGTTIPK